MARENPARMDKRPQESQRIEAEASLQVVTFESANPQFFLAHYGIAESSSRFGKPRWIEEATRLATSKTLSVAVVRGEGHPQSHGLARRSPASVHASDLRRDIEVAGGTRAHGQVARTPARGRREFELDIGRHVAGL